MGSCSEDHTQHSAGITARDSLHTFTAAAAAAAGAAPLRAGFRIQLRQGRDAREVEVGTAVQGYGYQAVENLEVVRY